MSAQLFATLLEWRRQPRARWLKKGKPVPENGCSPALELSPELGWLARGADGGRGG